MHFQARYETLHVKTNECVVQYQIHLILCHCHYKNSHIWWRMYEQIVQICKALFLFFDVVTLIPCSSLQYPFSSLKSIQMVFFQGVIYIYWSIKKWKAWTIKWICLIVEIWKDRVFEWILRVLSNDTLTFDHTEEKNFTIYYYPKELYILKHAMIENNKLQRYLR